jgi:hypothetical protein
MTMSWAPYQPIRQIRSNEISDGYLGVYQPSKRLEVSLCQLLLE